MKKGVPGSRAESLTATEAGRRCPGSLHGRPACDVPLPDQKILPSTTDADGRFRTGQVKSGEWFLVASAHGHAPADQSVKVGTAVRQVDIRLGRPHTFKGRVVDRNGKPVAGAFVDPDLWKRTYRCLGAYLWTDADGRFRWDDAPNDDLIVNVQKQGYVWRVPATSVAPTVEDIVFTAGALPRRFTGRCGDAETKNRVEKTPRA